MKYYIIPLLLLFCFTDIMAGGPWTKKKGEGYAQFSFYTIPPINRLSISSYRTQFLNRAVFDATAELYAEYGVAKRFTLAASIPVKFVSTSNQLSLVDSSQIGVNNIAPSNQILDAGLLVDLGNIRLAGKYNFLSKAVHSSIHFLLSTPTAIQKYNPNTALRTAYPCWGFQPSVSLGYSKTKFYTFLETGMNFRTHDYSHQWVANFEIGWLIFKKAYFAITLDANICLPNGKDVPSSNEDVQTGLYINNQNFVAMTLKAIIPVSKQVGINVSLSGGLWANNVQQGPNIGLGIYYKWNKREAPKTDV